MKYKINFFDTSICNVIPHTFKKFDKDNGLNNDRMRLCDKPLTLSFGMCGPF